MKEVKKIIVYAFLTSKHKWVSIPGLARETGLPRKKIKEFIEETDLLKRAKKKNRKGHVLYTLNEKAKQTYQLEKKEVKDIFKETKKYLLEGKLNEAIKDYYSILKGDKKLLPNNIQSHYKNNLIDISNQYYQLEELWKSDKISTKQRFEESDKFIYKLYESIIELETLTKEINEYKFKFKNVTIRIDKDFDSFKKSDEVDILNYLSNLLKLSKEEVTVKAIEQGSVIMTLEFENPEQAENLFLLIKLGKLKKEGISDAKLKMLSEKITLTAQSNQSEVVKICEKAKKLIQKGRAEKVVDFLLENINLIGKDFQNRLLLLSSDLSIVIEKSNLGLERFEEIRIIRNKITYALLDLIDEIKKKTTDNNG